jgi:23S rRNA (uracil1939-C5)-methyltransferase
MSQDPNATYPVTFERLVYGGEALGRLPDGRAVFVPFVLPGEQAEIRLVEDKPRFARGVLVRLITSSPERIQPRCMHFTECGGCHYQHMSYPAQLKAKTDILIDQLERIGKLNNPPVRPAIPAFSPWNYRNYIQFHQDPAGKLGYVRFDGQGVLAIQECHLPEPPLNKTWPRFDLEPIQGLERIGLRLGTYGDVLLTLESSEPEAADFSVDFDLSAVHLGPENSILLAGDDHVIMEVLERAFRVSAGSFFQVNTIVTALLVSQLLEAVNPSREELVLDVYCGVGLFSAFLAERAGQVVGVEASPYAVYDFEVNLAEFDNVSIYEGEAGEVLPLLELHPAIVVLDPPRAGVEIPALEAVIEMAPRLIAYVSCDPATLARDARRLVAGGYRLEEVTPYDLFPQTYHIESLSLFRKTPD